MLLKSSNDSSHKALPVLSIASDNDFETQAARTAREMSLPTVISNDNYSTLDYSNEKSKQCHHRPLQQI